MLKIPKLLAQLIYVKRSLVVRWVVLGLSYESERNWVEVGQEVVVRLEHHLCCLDVRGCNSG
jgi:hypothetical protein